MSRVGITLVVLSAVLGQAACSNPVSPPWLIDKPRVLGARVQARSETSRATLNPGETGRVDWLIAFPDGDRATQWSFVACAESGTLRGVPSCASTPFANAEGSSAAGEAPSFEITLPDAVSLGSAPEVLVAGQICSEGAAHFEWQTMTGSCDGADPGTTTDLRVSIGSPSAENANPSFPDTGVTFDGIEWTASDSSRGACASGPTVAPAGVHTLAVTIPSSAREAPGGSREVMQLSHFATRGTLPTQFSFVEADDPRSDPRIEVPWTAPSAAEVTAAGVEARLYFVLRDQRGGTSWAVRSVCVR
jgi:hypothetical protein